MTDQQTTEPLAERIVAACDEMMSHFGYHTEPWGLTEESFIVYQGERARIIQLTHMPLARFCVVREDLYAAFDVLLQACDDRVSMDLDALISTLPPGQSIQQAEHDLLESADSKVDDALAVFLRIASIPAQACAA